MLRVLVMISMWKVDPKSSPEVSASMPKVRNTDVPHEENTCEYKFHLGIVVLSVVSPMLTNE